MPLFFHGQYLPDDLRKELKSFVPKPEQARLQGTGQLPLYHEEEAAQQADHADAMPLEVRNIEPVACHDLRAVLGQIDLISSFAWPGAADWLAIAGIFSEIRGHSTF